MTRALLLPRLALSVLALATAAGVPSLRAQVIRMAPVRQAAPANMPPIRINDQTFNQWALGGRATPEVLRNRLESLLAMKIERIDRDCRLTDAQKRRLRLAGEGDIKRLHDRIEQKRRMLVNVPLERARLNEVLRELQPLRVAAQSDIFEEGSIFSKVLTKVLNPEQADLHRAEADSRRAYQLQTCVDLTVAMFDRTAGLSADQRRKFAALLCQNALPPTKPGPYDYYVLMIQAAEIPEEKIRPLFDDSQWNALVRQFQRARQMARVLREGGYMPRADAPKPEPREAMLAK